MSINESDLNKGNYKRIMITEKIAFLPSVFNAKTKITIYAKSMCCKSPYPASWPLKISTSFVYLNELAHTI